MFMKTLTTLEAAKECACLQTTVIEDTTVTSELQPDPTPSTSSETYTKEELVAILKLQKAGLLRTLQKDGLV